MLTSRLSVFFASILLSFAITAKGQEAKPATTPSGNAVELSAPPAATGLPTNVANAWLADNFGFQFKPGSEVLNNLKCPEKGVDLGTLAEKWIDYDKPCTATLPGDMEVQVYWKKSNYSEKDFIKNSASYIVKRRMLRASYNYTYDKESPTDEPKLGTVVYSCVIRPVDKSEPIPIYLLFPFSNKNPAISNVLVVMGTERGVSEDAVRVQAAKLANNLMPAEEEK